MVWAYCVVAGFACAPCDIACEAGRECATTAELREKGVHSVPESKIASAFSHGVKKPCFLVLASDHARCLFFSPHSNAFGSSLHSLFVLAFGLGALLLSSYRV